MNGSKRGGGGGGGSRVSDLIIHIYVHTRKGVSFFHYLRSRERKVELVKKGLEERKGSRTKRTKASARGLNQFTPPESNVAIFFTYPT